MDKLLYATKSRIDEMVFNEMLCTQISHNVNASKHDTAISMAIFLISAKNINYGCCTAWYVSDPVGNPEDRLTTCFLHMQNRKAQIIGAVTT